MAVIIIDALGKVVGRTTLPDIKSINKFNSDNSELSALTVYEFNSMKLRVDNSVKLY